MSQLDLPPISFARYLELLKRRRWQVLPMSIVGLLVGAIIAFFIPRYYVASTVLVYTGSVLDTKARTDLDPIYVMVRGAPTSIIAAIPDALESLQWIGTSLEDPTRQETIDRTVARTKVIAYPPEKGRTDYQIEIEYRDPDGPNSAAFTNELRRVWTEGLIREFNELAADDLRKASADVTALRQAVDNETTAIRNLREEHGLEMGEEDAGREGARRLLKDDLRERDAKIIDLDGQIVGLSTHIEQLQASIDEGFVQRTRIVERPIASDPQIAAQVSSLLEGMSYHEMAMGSFLPGTAKFDHHRGNYEHYRRQLQELVPQGLESGMRRVEEEDPRYRETVEAINDNKVALANLSAQLAVHQTFVDALEEKIATLSVVWEELEGRLSRKVQLETRLAAAHERADALDNRFDRAQTNTPFKKVSRANVPPAPTDPDVTIVAIAGSILGLAAAIGLILLLDFLRSTYKTVDDVNYGLRLPVLGVMSYLQTDEARTHVVRQRRRVSIVVAVFVVLVLSILTVYYVAPTRLPPAVLQVFDSILGSETGR